MPNIKKTEYDSLKARIKFLELELETEKLFSKTYSRALRDQQYETEKWKRYYEASREAFRIEDTLDIPGCFNPMDSIEYIIRKQEESDIPNRHAC